MKTLLAGLEPATAWLTATRSDLLSYRSVYIIKELSLSTFQLYMMYHITNKNKYVPAEI